MNGATLPKASAAKRKAKAEEDSNYDEPSSSEQELDSGGSDYEPEEEEVKPKASAKKSAKKPRASLGECAADGAAASPAVDPKLVERLRKSLKTQLSGQMVYKRSLIGGSSRMKAELPNLTFPQVKAILGPALMAKAKNGPKQLQVAIMDYTDEVALLGASLHKPLRYGATLGVTAKGLKLVFTKEDGMLSVAGAFTMHK